MTAERKAFLERLRHVGARAYHDKHPFHLAMNNGRLSADAIRCWAANRFYYQQNIPRKDAAILANCPLREIRRVWIHRIIDHDGAPAGATTFQLPALAFAVPSRFPLPEAASQAGALRTAHATAQERNEFRPSDNEIAEGGIEAWLRLGEACGLARNDLLENRQVVPGVRFAVDAYVNFARTEPWSVAIASSLTELFAPDLMAARLAAFERHYRWVEPDGLSYFRHRLTQARRDSDEALAITLDYCNTPELQDAAVGALAFKCDVLWSMLDAIDLHCRR